MTHETKAGLVVTASFLSLVGLVLLCKMREQEQAAPEPYARQADGTYAVPDDPVPSGPEPGLGSQEQGASTLQQVTGELTLHDPSRSEIMRTSGTGRAGSAKVAGPVKPPAGPAAPTDENNDADPLPPVEDDSLASPTLASPSGAAPAGATNGTKPAAKQQQDDGKSQNPRSPELEEHGDPDHPASSGVKPKSTVKASGMAAHANQTTSPANNQPAAGHGASQLPVNRPKAATGSPPVPPTKSKEGQPTKPLNSATEVPQAAPTPSNKSEGKAPEANPHSAPPAPGTKPGPLAPPGAQGKTTAPTGTPGSQTELIPPPPPPAPSAGEAPTKVATTSSVPATPSTNSHSPAPDSPSSPAPARPNTVPEVKLQRPVVPSATNPIGGDPGTGLIPGAKPDHVPTSPPAADDARSSGHVQLNTPANPLLSADLLARGPDTPTALSEGSRLAPVRPVPPVGAPAGAGSPPIPIPMPPQPGAAVTPQVESYDEEMYRCKPEDIMERDKTFKIISTHFYHTDKYAQALFLFNRDHPRAAAGFRQDPPSLKAGEAVFIPPLWVLEKRYPSVIPNLPPLPSLASLAHPTDPAWLNQDAKGKASGAWATPSGEHLYRVKNKDGEYFYDIARRTLTDSRRWVDIARLNPRYNPEYPVPAGVTLWLPADARVDPDNAP